MNFETIKRNFAWKAIHDCPGRYTFKKVNGNYSLQELLGTGIKFRRFDISKAKDPIYVVKLEDGGVISFLKADGRFVHTLNNEEGFKRKLTDLGIKL